MLIATETLISANIDLNKRVWLMESEANDRKGVAKYQNYVWSNDISATVLPILTPSVMKLTVIMLYIQW